MITVEKVSRLGNQLFQLAALIGIARRTGYEYGVSVPQWKDVTSLVENFTIQNIDLNEFKKTRTRVFVDGHDYQKFWEDCSIPDGVSLRSYFNNEMFFRDVREDIIKLYKPKHEHIQTAQKIIDENNIKACIHVRGTDYVKIGYVPSRKIYDAIYNHLQERVGDDKICVVTDDVKLARDIFQKHDVNIQSNNQFIDFTLLYLADSACVMNSTFSFWSRWLTEKYTCVPKYFRKRYGCSLDWEIVDHK